MKNDPHIITLRYRTACACGLRLERGDAAVVYPLERKVVCMDCGQPDIIACREEDRTRWDGESDGGI